MSVSRNTYTNLSASRPRLAGQEGFTMIIAIGVLFVATLLMVAAFTAANGDIQLAHSETTQKQAYYAALAGIQEYEYQLQVNPDYWEACPAPSGTVNSSESAESYAVTPLTAASYTKGSTCSAAKPFETMIESSGSEANTFRIESTGTAGKSSRSMIATFKVTGFLNFIYYTNFEVLDPALYLQENTAEKEACETHYAENGEPERPSSCQSIQFPTGDKINGPMHTNAAVLICGEPTFGRSKHNPLDVIEFVRGIYKKSGCSDNAVFNTAEKLKPGKEGWVKGTELPPPVSDTSLASYVEPANEFTGVTHLVLNGLANTITVTNEGTTKTISWPTNGLIWVQSNSEKACSYTYEPYESDETKESTGETNCGNVYVSGTYSQSLTIGSDDDVIIDGNVYPTSVAGKLGAEPTGTGTLGLIANNYVRVYHAVEQTYKPNVKKECKEFNKQEEELNPSTGLCEYTNTINACDAENLTAAKDPNGYGSLEEPWIYAAILSTKHSFIVDNYRCGDPTPLKKLNVYGAIAQNFRGTVGTGSASEASSGYIKNYNYDQRLAVDEPPYFLSPLNAGWKVSRLTAPTAG